MKEKLIKYNKIDFFYLIICRFAQQAFENNANDQ